ncbi:uncharacterized protein LOC122949784 [Acropora millepora]|uniref:uncharacterized protein LOC122949784 n=1 Tax=Acropora millepora TaxID=45264 RepID=UPI001CF4792A|nr:uncharacterized protein LOC122949784 [Acropora millepora]
MKVGTMLAALDHNFNVNRPQAVIQTGESQGEPRFKISWSKVSKRFEVEPVLEQKNYEYLEDMLQAALQLAASGTKATPRIKNRNSIMTPEQRPSRQEIIDTRKRLSRFK